MNYYLFLTPSIVSIGGAELYVARKVKHLREMGWYPIVFSFCKGDIKIEDLRGFNENIVAEFELKYSISNVRIRNGVLKNVESKVKEACQIIVESHTTNLAYWGEYIASCLNATHLCYLLTETFPKLSNLEHVFFENKLKQNLLRGIVDLSVTKLFSDGNKYNVPRLPALGNIYNSIDDKISYDYSIYRNADFKILSLGRLNKPYIEEMLRAVYTFSKANPNRTINLTLLGGYFVDKIKAICEEVQCGSMVEIIHIDECNPIPANIFSYNDIAIAVAGCARICTDQNLPTITVDANDKKAIGVLDVTTNNTILRQSEEPQEIYDLIEDLLIKKKYSLHHKEQKPQCLDYSEHDRYFEVKQTVYRLKTERTASDVLFCIMLTVLGFKGYNVVMDWLRTIKKIIQS